MCFAGRTLLKIKRLILRNRYSRLQRKIIYYQGLKPLAHSRNDAYLRIAFDEEKALRRRLEAIEYQLEGGWRNSSK